MERVDVKNKGIDVLYCRYWTEVVRSLTDSRLTAGAMHPACGRQRIRLEE